MTDDKLYTSLSANAIMAKLTNHVQRTRLKTPSTDKHYSLDSEDDFRSGCRNVGHQKQFFSELLTLTITQYKLQILLGSNHLLCMVSCLPNPRLVWKHNMQCFSISLNHRRVWWCAPPPALCSPASRSLHSLTA